MKRIFLAALLLALVLSGCGQAEPEETTQPAATQPLSITIAGEAFPRDAEIFDLRELAVSAEEYRQLRELCPQAQILWKVPFQGLRLDTGTRQLTLEAIGETELENLAWLPDLQTITLHACPSRAVLDALAQIVPQCQVRYQVTLADRRISWDAPALTLESRELPEAMEALAFLPKLKTVTLSDTLEEVDALLALKEAYPDITFRCSFSFFGLEVSSEAEEVELNKVTIDSVEAVERLLPLFNNLKKLALLRCGLPSQELDALWKRHPETRIVWTIPMAWAWVRTDVTKIMPFQYGYDGYYPELRLGDEDFSEFHYLVDVVCMDLGHHNLSSIEFVRSMPNLQYLIIADTRVADLSPLAGLQKLEYLEAFLNGVEDLSPLLECPALRDVNLCFNDITDLSPLMEMEQLEHIWIAGNYDLTKEQRQELAERLPNAVIVNYTESATGAGWREIPRYYAQRDYLGMFYMTG